MVAELAYAAVIAIILLSAMLLAVWGGMSVINKIRDSRLEEMSPDPVEYEAYTPAQALAEVDSEPVREYAVSKPLPMPKGEEAEHLCFEQARENFKVTGQLVSDVIEEVQGRDFGDTNAVQRGEDYEFLNFAQKQAEGNNPKLYEHLKPDTEYEFTSPDLQVWELAGEYQALKPADFNTHLKAICIVLKYFPLPEQYVQDPFYFQMRQMMTQREQLEEEKAERGGSAKLVEKLAPATPESKKNTVQAIRDLTTALEEAAAKAEPKRRRAKRKARARK